jgi:hypothetical protein
MRWGSAGTWQTAVHVAEERAAWHTGERIVVATQHGREAWNSCKSTALAARADAMGCYIMQNNDDAGRRLAYL